MADAWVLKGSVRGPQGEPGEPGQPGSPGAAGVDGASAGFGAPTATVDSTTGTPSVEVTATGPDTAKVFAFEFSGLKGERGATGAAGQTGATPVVSATATVDSGVGTPSVTVTKGGTTAAPSFAFAFKNVKGETGARGPAGADGSDATVTAGNGVSVSGGQVSVKLAASSGMTSTSEGLALDFPTDEELLEYLGLG